MLTSFRAVNFRGFEDLTVDRLGRVNLITGRNGVGKTNLLEAITVWARGGRPDDLANLLEARQEDQHHGPEDAAIRALFRHAEKDRAVLRLGPSDGSDALGIRLGYQIRRADPTTGEERVELSDTPDPDEDSRAALIIESERGRRSVRASLDVMSRAQGRTWPERVPAYFVFAAGLSEEEVETLWHHVAGFPFESELTRLLGAFAPVRNVHVLAGARGDPYVRVTLADTQEPIAMASLGDGIQRAFHIALGLAAAKGGVLLLDEVENGIHYAVQDRLWAFVFDAARRLDVQVFATTHSWDCIQAFQAASAASPEDGVLVRLAREAPDVLRAYTFGEEELAGVTRLGLEVR